MANPSDTLTLHASGAESGAGQGTAVDIESVRSAALITLETADTANLQVSIETSADGSSAWKHVASMTPDDTEIAVAGLSRYIRATWGSTTDATFEVTAIAHQLLARPVDLYAKLSRKICDAIDAEEPGTVARSLIEATDVVVGPLGAFRDIDCMITHFGLSAGPIGEVELTLDFKDVPLSIVGAVANIARLLVLQRHGFVGGGVDELAVAADKQAREWLLGIGASGGGSALGGVASGWRWSIPTARR